MTGVVTTAGSAMIAAGVASAGLGEDYDEDYYECMYLYRKNKKRQSRCWAILEYMQPA